MPRFAATMKAIEKGVDQLSPSAAVKLIEDWKGQLAEAEFRGSKGILRDLEALEKELGRGEKMNGDKVRTLTAKLGEATAKSAEGVEGQNGEKLKALGDALAAVGQPEEAGAKD